MPLIHSYSALNAFSICPRQYEARYVLKTTKSTTSPALEKGRDWHAALEHAVQTGEGLPAHLARWRPLVAALHAGGARAEATLAIDRAGQPCGYWDAGAWLRGAIDIEWTRAGQCLMLDWKTGKVHPDPVQADVYSALRRASDPALAVEFHFVYLEHRKTVALRPDKGALQRVSASLTRLEDTTRFAPRPCFACRFCPVTTCEYWDGGKPHAQ